MNTLENIDIITLQNTPEEQSLDFCPKTFDEYLGQTELKNKLAVYTQAAKMRTNRWITCSFLALRDWVKQLCRKLWQRNERRYQNMQRSHDGTQR
jgi:hypothetical protein